ncbi:MAG: linear amide C-N hydrolase [Clostridia bacterium]|nr:linear amide C-N hydrolase [Clostridia bacterium]
MKIFKRILLALLSVILLTVIFFCTIYFSRFRSIATIEELTDYEDGYNLYSMDIKYNYDIDDIINSGYTNMQEFVDAVIKESLPLLPVKIKVPSYGCSAYRSTDVDGNVIMGRNYDFKLDTSALMVKCSPKNGYKSISFCALNNVSADRPESLSKKMACLTAPFIGLDGVNEKGVSIAVLTLPSEPTMHETGKPKLATSLLIRLVLDKAASTEEAIELIKNYDIFSSNGRDYHFIISDATGNSVAVEFDCEDPERKMVVTPTEAITNFFVMHSDKVEPSKDNGMYGKGKERYNAMLEVLNANEGNITRDVAWEAIKAAAQNPNPEDITSNTQ